MTTPKLLIAVLVAASVQGCGGGSAKNPESANGGGTDSDAPIISIAGGSFAEGNSGESTVWMKLTREGDLSGESTVTYAIDPITSAKNEDYKGESGTAHFSTGLSMVQVPLTIIGDEVFEDDETVKVTLTARKNAQLIAETATAQVVIRNDDSVPAINFKSPSLMVAEIAGSAKVVAALSNPTATTVIAKVKMGGTANSGDYSTTTTSFQFPPLSTEAQIDIRILRDTIPEGGETIEMEFIPSSGVSLGDRNKQTTVIMGQVGLNDTGATTYTDGAAFGLAEEPADLPGQDASVGADVRSMNMADGYAGLSFTKLDTAGNVVPPSSENFACVRDNRTNITYEIRTEGNSINAQVNENENENSRTIYEMQDQANWRSSSFQYFWYNDDPKTMGGSPGHQGEPVDRETGAERTCGYKREEDRPHQASCDTRSYVAEANWRGLCGFKDWRVPTIEELRSIAIYETTSADTNGRLDENFMPYGMPDDAVSMIAPEAITYFSSSSAAGYEASAWCFNPFTGSAKLCHKGTTHYLRIARGGTQ